MTHILMVAAENAALPDAKVGGIGDVVRDVPPALARRGCKVSIVIPAYGYLHKTPGAIQRQSLTVSFANGEEKLEIYHLTQHSLDNVDHYVINHPLFSSCGVGKIYCNDPPERPFSQDATKFALFCIAVAEAIMNNAFGKLDVLHLHDWHAAFLLILRRFMRAYRKLNSLHCAFSIHNLALQGIRPLKDDPSSLQHWYTTMAYEADDILDPRWRDCVNPMAAAIRLADTVHAVSPSYAEEILQPGDIANGQYGGEGLERSLIQANKEKRLYGILNGCYYKGHKRQRRSKKDWPQLKRLMTDTLLHWISHSENLSSAHFIASNALPRLRDERPPMLLTSIGRITNQKIELMRQPTSSGKPALHAALEKMGDYATLIVIGSGDLEYESFLNEAVTKYHNMIYLRGYSDPLANALYRQGDLFFMPSSFEPCGISQMLALREGQPCLVHGVGGLRDTIIDGKTGFVFSGTGITEQADAMIETLQRAIDEHNNNPTGWQAMRKAAAAARFEWDDSIDHYLRQLYKIT